MCVDKNVWPAQREELFPLRIGVLEFSLHHLVEKFVKREIVFYNKLVCWHVEFCAGKNRRGLRKCFCGVGGSKSQNANPSDTAGSTLKTSGTQYFRGGECVWNVPGAALNLDAV